MNSKVLYQFSERGIEPQFLDIPVDYPIAWTRSSLRIEDIRFPLSRECQLELDAVVASLRNDPLPILVLRPDMFELSACNEYLAAVRATLVGGAGFAILDRLPVEDLSVEEAKAIYWLLGCLLSRPVAQKFNGMMLFDVLDTGVHKGHGGAPPVPDQEANEFDHGVRGSTTNARLVFHTDCSWGIIPPQFVGLLCLRQAKKGGKTFLINWSTVIGELRNNTPELVRRGFQPFFFDRNNEHAPSAPPVIAKPVFHYEDGLKVNISLAGIRDGYKLVGQSLDSETEDFLNAIEKILKKKTHRTEFYLKSGQMLFVNNATIGHERTPFEDDPHPERKRFLVRMWLRDYGRISFQGT